MLSSELRSTADIDVSELSHAHVDTEPVDRDWSVGYPEQWEYFDAEECSECETVCLVSAGFIRCTNEDCDLYDDEQDVYAEGPMMNYSYACDVDTDAAIELVHLPLCIVRFEDGETCLALTGGGMDLSWQICEAYMRLGFIPPTHYARLPMMGGRGSSEGDKRIIEACRESARGTMNYGQSVLNELDRIEQFAREESERRANA